MWKKNAREICDVVFRAKADQKIGSRIFRKGQPVLYIDTAKTTSLEGAADQAYATGGKGNPRLISWDSNKTLTLSVEDALFSPIGLSILAGANLLKAKEPDKASKSNGSGFYNVHVHAPFTTTITAFTVASDTKYGIDISSQLDTTAAIGSRSSWFCPTAPVFVSTANIDNSIEGGLYEIGGFYKVSGTGYEEVILGQNPHPVDDLGITMLEITELDGVAIDASAVGDKVFVDFYKVMGGSKVDEIQITPDKFGGAFYVEAHTTFRRQYDQKDLPAILTFPNVRIQSNFTIDMSAEGDPSSCTFTMDCFPGYSYFDSNHEVLCAMQIIDDAKAVDTDTDSIFKHVETAPYTDVYDPARTGDNTTAGNITNTGIVGYDDSHMVAGTDYTTT